MLDVNPTDVYKQIERTIFGTNAQPAPLLKYYNDVLATTKFEMPPRVKLETDQELFKKILRKYRGAQELEVQWVKKQGIIEAKKYVMKQFEHTSEALKHECMILIKKHNDVIAQL